MCDIPVTQGLMKKRGNSLTPSNITDTRVRRLLRFPRRNYLYIYVHKYSPALPLRGTSKVIRSRINNRTENIDNTRSSINFQVVNELICVHPAESKNLLHSGNRTAKYEVKQILIRKLRTKLKNKERARWIQYLRRSPPPRNPQTLAFYFVKNTGIRLFIFLY